MYACEDIIANDAGLVLGRDAMVRGIYVTKKKGGKSSFALAVVIQSDDWEDRDNYMPGPPKPEVVQKLKETFGFTSEPKWYTAL